MLCIITVGGGREGGREGEGGKEGRREGGREGKRKRERGRRLSSFKTLYYISKASSVAAIKSVILPGSYE